MMTYLVLNIVFLVVVSSLVLRWKYFRQRPLMVTLAALLAMTAVFDNLIIMSGIVDYNHTLLLGIYIGVAPVEDFFYAVMAVVLVPALWHSMDKENT